MILGLRLEFFLAPKLDIAVFFLFFHGTFCTKRLGLLSRGFRKESIAKTNCSQKLFFMDFGVDVLRFFAALGPVSLIFAGLENI